MQPIDVDTRELSAASFGNLFHKVVESLSEQTLDHQTTVSELKKPHYISMLKTSL